MRSNLVRLDHSLDFLCGVTCEPLVAYGPEVDSIQSSSTV